MKIAFIHGHMLNVHTWSKVYDLLRPEGVELHFFSQVYSAQAALDFLHDQTVDLFIGQLFHDLPRHDELLAGAQQASYRIGLGMDIPQGFSSFDPGQSARFAHYLSHISVNNYLNGIRFLMACTGKDVAYAEPEPVRTHGIYHPEASSFFESTPAYLQWWRQDRKAALPDQPLVGLLCYYGQIAEGNCAEIDAVIRCLEENGLIPLCVASEGLADSSLPLAQRYTWLPFLQNADSSPSVLLNLLAGRLLSRSEDVSILEALNVPVVQLIRLYHQSPEEWRADYGGLSAGAQSMVYALSQPEMAGVIEPTAVAASTSETDARTGLKFRRYLPLEERIEHLCRRLHRWIRLRTLPHREKRLTIVLHNNPCKGVEATLGLAAGLDTFASLAALIRALREAGYDTSGAPEDGAALLNLLLERKAISEFRWTTTDEIVTKGGVLHYTTEGEYENLLARLPDQARKRIVADWGPFPGEGMVYQKNGDATLLVTGMRFGNLQIMVQPKRGCYGAKCNGEVCRILHDPHLSPPPHWLATYQYIRDTSDAVLHFGAHGSLEFLPGKQVALSEACFPEISLGDLPNLYLYVMDAPSEGLVAKRRARAVLVDHLTPVQRPAELDKDTTALEELLEQYQKARANGEGKRQNLLREQMLPLMHQLNFAGQAAAVDRFDEAVALLSRQIARCKRSLTPLGLHRLGVAPDPEGIATMLATILIKPADDRPSLEEIAAWSTAPSGNTFNDARDLIRSLLVSEPVPEAERAEPARFAALRQWCRDVGGRIAMSSREIPQLLKALDGGFIEPGLSGSLALGKTQTLPTGRNFYTSDVLAMPTRAAWEVGKELADNLLRKYLREEGRFPESVGISLWSIDAFKSDGEVFCQILHLMGMRPLWAGNGRVTTVEVIELDSLTLNVEEGPSMPRPRVDVVIQASSILRDMVPHFADLLDEAAVMAGDLDEPVERNCIRKHTIERLTELRQELAERLSESELKRLASFRVFSSAPGTFGTGIGLALDASAWQTDDDLAETYINWGGYAFGSDRIPGFSKAAGLEAHRLYARNLKTVEVTYMRQYSPEYDLVDCGCYTGCLGGMSVAAKAVSGKRAKLYWADTNAEGDLSVRDFKDDIAASVRAKLFNSHWIEQQKRDGYKGAGGVSSCVNNLFKWSATTGEVDKWVFDTVVATYIQDRENLEWLRRDNPYGLEEITRRLLEAHSRGLWQADPDLLQEVQAAALLIEGDMEEIIGEVSEEFQGSKVEVLTARDVAKWQHKWRLKDGS